MRHCRGVMSLVALLLLAKGLAAATYKVGPLDEWCASINRAVPGDEVILAAGSYTTPCSISVTGASGSPILVRSASEDLSSQAVLAYSGATSNIIDLWSKHLILRWLSFGPTQEDVDAIKIRRSNDVIIEKNLFQGIGGISIAANDSSTKRITVRDNTFKDLKSTGIYFGCHEGECSAADFLIERNLIDGVTTPFDPNSIGYGMQFKLNSYGVLRDNTIYRTKGPGIMVYGSNRGDPATVVEGNHIEGSRTEGGIVIGGGPAVVRNNVLVGNAYGGISAQNYVNRNLQQNIWIVHNTVLDNDDSGINVQQWTSGSGNVIAYNAILPRTGTCAIRPSSPAGTIVGNVTCTSSCFVNAATPPYDLRPTPGGPLVDAAGGGPETWRPFDDFMGVPRGRAVDVGAFERTSSANAHTVGGGKPRPARAAPAGTTP